MADELQNILNAKDILFVVACQITDRFQLQCAYASLCSENKDDDGQSRAPQGEEAADAQTGSTVFLYIYIYTYAYMRL